MKVFELRDGRRVTFYKGFATLSRYCHICENWTCKTPNRASKKDIKEAIDYAREEKQRRVTLGCQSFGVATAAVKFAMRWVKR